jgi:hypothetical protein
MTPVQVNFTDKFHIDWPGIKPEAPRSDVINCFKITFPLYPQEIFSKKKFDLYSIKFAVRQGSVFKKVVVALAQGT